ncbi:putative double-stranded RNA binding motif containing protein [Lyophyllum shimeji]|uniref:Double-stranded RNA binding motif containing protein n=1 Tax=Lyophyllum shimeji TaxID=47721 RepID=A0A9P3PH54_LYOSH|nr:putative double-stranded RNA binding motif containing protein [Lyophyllum shimeji]
MNNTTPGALTSAPLKRPRPADFSGQAPPLPKVSSDLILQVFTHISLRRSTGRAEDYGDNERLIQLGKAALDASVTCALFNKRPMLNTPEICSQREEALSNANVDKWVTMYNMRQKLRCHPDVFPTLNSPKETMSLFHAYLGGVYAEHGIETVQEWISHLLLGRESQPIIRPRSMDETPQQPIEAPPTKRVKSEQPPPYQQPPIFFASQPPPSPPRQRHTPPHMALPNPLAPAQPNLPFLPLFNQTAMQRRVTVEYPAEFSGPPHAGRWSVRCIVNGIQKGVGTGSSKQVAKEEAARQAYYAMGWT